MKDWVTSSEKEIQEGAQEGEPATPEQKEDFEARHKEASDMLSRKAEELIDAKVEIAEANPKKILTMDKSMQNKVIKKLYGYNNIEELKSIQGDNFYEADETSEDEEEDKFASIEKKLRIMQYEKDKSEKSRAFDNFKVSNPDIFKDENAIDKLNAEMENISINLPAKERLDKAAKIAFGNIVSSVDEAYLKLQQVGTVASSKPKPATTGTEKNPLADVFGEYRSK